MTEKYLVAFENSPFPYAGMIPEQNRPFLDHDADGAYHLAPRAGKLRAATYEDRRSLLFIPPRFDPRRRDAALVLFFHGNLATLTRDVVARQRVPEQLVASHLNAVLVAPQMASDANDSSAGRFWERGFLDTYLDEAARHLAERSRGFTVQEIDQLPVIIVAYSGGYLPAAFSLLDARRGSLRHRIEGVVLLDALFGEEGKFADWIESAQDAPFFVSLYSKASSGPNAALADRFAARAERRLPPRIGPATIAFDARLSAVHNDFVTRAGIADPMADVLRRIADKRSAPLEAPGAGSGDAGKADVRRAAARRPANSQPAPCPSDAADCSAATDRP